MASESTDVGSGAFIHIYTHELSALHHVFVTLATVALIASLDVDTITSALTTWFGLTFIIILTDVSLRVEMIARVTVTDVAVQVVLTLSMTTNVPAQLALICLG